MSYRLYVALIVEELVYNYDIYLLQKEKAACDTSH